MIFIILITLIILSYLLHYHTVMKGTGELMMVISISILVVAVLLWPLFYMSIESEIDGFESVRMTVNKSRNNISPIETAAIQLKIAEMNEWLVKIQYWNETIFELYIPDEVNNLEIIQ